MKGQIDNLEPGTMSQKPPTTVAIVLNSEGGLEL